MSSELEKFLLIPSMALIFAVWPLLMPSAVFAQSIMPPRLDLEKAVETALETNPQTKLAETGVRIAEIKVNQARLGKKPGLQFSQSVMRSNNPVFVFGSLLEQGRFGPANFAIDALNKPDGMMNFRSAVNAQMPLYDQRQTASRITIAQTEKSQSELQAESVRQQLRFNVLRSYFAVVLAKETRGVTTQSVRSAEANVKKTKDMVEVGMTTEADFLMAEVELASAKQSSLEAESGIATANAALNILLGAKPEFERELTDDLTEKYFPVAEQDELIRTALVQRPDYERAQLALKNSREQSKSVKNQTLPRVDAFGSFGYSSPYIANGSTDYTVGVSLTYTLFDAGKKLRSELAAEGESAAALELENLANQIRLEVVRAYQSHKTAKARIQVSVKSIAQAEEVLRISQDRYKFGLTTFNEVLRAEAVLVKSKNNLLAARFEYLISYASVLLATGKLTDVSSFK
jgi:outer membrane protein